MHFIRTVTHSLTVFFYHFSIKVASEKKLITNHREYEFEVIGA